MNMFSWAVFSLLIAVILQLVGIFATKKGKFLVLSFIFSVPSLLFMFWLFEMFYQMSLKK